MIPSITHIRRDCFRRPSSNAKARTVNRHAHHMSKLLDKETKNRKSRAIKHTMTVKRKMKGKFIFI